jgi:hypothetical protein
VHIIDLHVYPAGQSVGMAQLAVQVLLVHVSPTAHIESVPVLLHVPAPSQKKSVSVVALLQLVSHCVLVGG